jgi:hypothetical protein
MPFSFPTFRCRKMFRIAVWFALAVCVWSGGAFFTNGSLGETVARAQTAGQRQFSPQERAKLAKGELVVRRIDQRRGPFHLVGGNSWQLIGSPAENVWRALLDTYHYRRTIPAVLESTLIRDRGQERIVFLRQGSRFLQVTYYLKLSIRADRKEIDFCIDDKLPHSIKTGWGFFSVRPYSQGTSVLAYGVMVDVGDNFLADLVRGSAREWMLKVPSQVKRFLEGRGRYLYRNEKVIGKALHSN